MKSQIEVSPTRYPSQINIETIHGCNARCVFCHVNLWSRPRGMMSDEVFDAIVEQLKEWAPQHIHQTALQLNGEPLLDPKLEQRVARCKKEGLPNVGFTTNGELMNDDRASKIIAASPDYVVFSFDTLDKDMFESQRLRLKHGTVLNNLLGFIKQRNESRSNVRIVIRHIDHKADKSEFEQYRLFFKDLLIEELDEIGYTKVHNAAFAPSIKGEFQDGHCGTTACGAVFNRLTIQHDGHVVLCPHDFNAEFNFGSVLECDLVEIFNTVAFERIRRIHESGLRNTMNKCISCDEPELNNDGDMYAKFTPSGKRFFANVYYGFDHSQERRKAEHHQA